MTKNNYAKRTPAAIKDLKSGHCQRCTRHLLNKKEVKTVLDLQEEASNTLAKDQFLKKAEDVAMPRILWALGQQHHWSWHQSAQEPLAISKKTII